MGTISALTGSWTFVMAFRLMSVRGDNQKDLLRETLV